MFAKRELDEYATDCVVVVENLDTLNNLAYGGRGGEGDVHKLHPNLLRGLGLHADVCRRVGTFPGLDDGHLRLETRICLLDRSNACSDRLASRP